MDPIGDPNFLEAKPLHVWADLNFNGTIEANESQVFDVEAAGFFSVSFLAADDGPWPGNEDPTDNITVNADFAGDSKSTDVEVKNISPVILSEPIFSYYPGPNGSTLAKVGISFLDQGSHDLHRIKVTWGDGVVSETLNYVRYEADENCGGQYSGTVERTVQPGSELLPLTVEVIDDDAGRGSRTVSKMDIGINNDDDNANNSEDLFDRGFNDDDLKLINLASLKPIPPTQIQGSFWLNYDFDQIRIWTSQNKTELILPFGNSLPASLNSPWVEYSGQSSAWVEGISLGESFVSVTWKPNEPNSDRCWDGAIPGNSMIVRVWTIDLDIDSDNNNGFDPPEETTLEEYLEDNSYALGNSSS